MPNNSQQVALHTWLILVPILLMVMGVFNGLATWQLPLDWNPSKASMPLMLLVGGGLLATMLNRPRWARLCGALLLPFGLYAPMLALLPGGHWSSLEIWPVPMALSTSITLLAVSACLLAGKATRRARLGWVLAGLVVVSIGGISLAEVLRPGVIMPGPWGTAFTTPFTALPALLTGVAMVLVGRRASAPPVLSRVMVLALAGGVMASGLAWYALTWQQYDAKQRHATELLANFKITAERAIDTQQVTLQRMSERWAHFGGRPPLPFRETEFDSYFRDMPSLVSLYWQDESERFRWGRDRSHELLFHGWVRQDDAWLLDWLAVGGSYPRWVIPDPLSPELAVVSLPLPGAGYGQMVSVLDLERLLGEELNAIVTPLMLSLYRQDRQLAANHAAERELGLRLHRGLIVLPGGATLEARVYDAAVGPLAFGGMMPLNVAIGGLILSYLLAFSLGMASLSRRRSVSLARTQRHLRAQQRVQTLIARDQPLSDTLRAICRMVEAQAPGSQCSIMLCGDDHNTLESIYSVSLPESYCEAVRGVGVGPGVGTCGRAAHIRDFVVCADIALDPYWAGYHDLAAEHGLRACWSYPVIASDGRLLGAFGTYFKEPGEPTRADRRRIIESAELVSLAVEREQNRRALRESEQRYRSLFTYHPDAVFSLDLQGYFLTANDACCKITGYTLERLIGSHFSDLIEPSEQARIAQLYQDAGKGEAFRYTLALKRQDGSSVYLDLTNLPIVVNERVIGFYGIAKDMTERYRHETELRILQRSVEASINGVVIADAQAKGMPIIYANGAFERMTGYTREEVLGRNCRILQGRETDPDSLDQIRRALADFEEVNVTLCNYRKDGSPFWNNLYLAPVRDTAGVVTHFVGVQHDISERKAYEAKLSFHASHDALTGLANRSLFEDHLLHDVQLARRHGRHLAVLFLDLDDFKPINDSLGHEVGDQVLIEVAQRLADELDPGDTLARFGSDEYVILLPELSREEAALRLTERLLACVARPFRIAENELYIGASVGVAFLYEGLKNPVELIQQADMAMYRAKQKGRNAWECFTSDLNDEVSSRMALRNDLQEAIEAENFELHYQPLLNAADGSVVGFEALVRWKHPVRGYLSPGLFIPLAEDTGQIGPISEWVLRRACLDMCLLAAQGYGHHRVSVNLSPLQFHRPNFMTNLQQALLETGLAPGYLELELTEGILMNDTAAAIATLHKLRDMGIEVSVDDFGTGYSSLSYLKQLPIGKIKIDRSFIRDVTTNPHDSAIVQGIISMAHHLGLMVVAEGIEEEAQRDFLAEHGCDVFQGFYFARPMPLDGLKRYMIEHHQMAPDASDPQAASH
ncbi:EAL domain-containing protein [Halomonas chromatireducens]|uniref:cyclic-guanylate-specific phosphodiesterase n=1 Tax=Halomonas chromatireducens TaxID=507626 RepID=A0A109UMH3_9GAMM|nr:EAL domain-containing protein [Halomonas chromatireducens]AMD01832.1 Phytochrome-like protein cph2 [Halomonas chromatireducens]